MFGTDMPLQSLVLAERLVAGWVIATPVALLTFVNGLVST